MAVGIKQWIQQVTDRALEMLDMRPGESPLEDLLSQCHAVLSRRGEATGLALACSVVSSWHALPEAVHVDFFERLLAEFGPDVVALQMRYKPISPRRMRPGASIASSGRAKRQIVSPDQCSPRWTENTDSHA